MSINDRSRARSIAGYVGILTGSILLLAWALHDVALPTMIERIRTVDRGYLLAATTTFLAAMLLRGLRWRALLRAHESVTPRAAIQATFYGATANNLLPARAGEFVRAIQLARVTEIGPATALGSIALLRAIDVAALLVLLLVGLLLDGPHGSDRIAFAGLQQTQWMAAGIVLLAASILLLAKRIKPHLLEILDRLAQWLPTRHRTRIQSAFERFITGLTLLDTPFDFALLALWTVAVWVAHTISLVLAMRAFDLGAPWSSALLVQFLIGFAIALPSAPGFFGAFEAAGRVGLAAYGIGATEAVAFTLTFHVSVALLPTLVVALVLSALPQPRPSPST